MRTQVAIVGAGPAGMFLALLLHGHGVDCVVLERRGRDYVEGRVRAGVLERISVDAMAWLGPGAKVVRGPSFEKNIVPLRSFVAEPMRFGNLFLAGDAAHIVPPAGAKGLNLAVTDVIFLADCLAEYYRACDQSVLDLYSRRALSRDWRAERFSWWFTGLTHRFAEMDSFGRKIQLAELDSLRDSVALQTVFAQNYAGLPLDQGAIRRVFKEKAVSQ